MGSGRTAVLKFYGLRDNLPVDARRHRHRRVPPPPPPPRVPEVLGTLDREFPRDLPLHLIVDNYRTHTRTNVNAWLERHPRFHLHPTPTSNSWLNLVERWFRELTDKVIRRGVFHSVPDLIEAIDSYLTTHNNDPKPLIWTASAEAIIDKVNRCKAVLETAH